MKVLIVFLAIAAICAAENPFAIKSKVEANNPIQDFVEGLLKGIHETKTVEDLIKCMKSADEIIVKIKAALKLIRTLNIEAMLQGLSMLFESLFEIEEMLRPCLMEFTQFKKLIQAIAEMNINKVVQKIISNAFQFIAIIIDCIKNLESANYTRAGMDLGNVLYLLFLDEFGFQAFDPVAFIKGFLEGINEKGDINELLKCVKNIEQIVTKIIEAIELIKKMDFINLVKGITMLIESITELLSVLKPCSSGFEQIKKLIEAVGKIDVVKLVFKILHDPGPFVQDIIGAIDAFKNGNYQNAGKYLGDFLYRLFLTSTE